MAAYCEIEGCTGHLGKFRDCYAEALYELTLDGMSDDGNTGSTEFEGHYSLFVLTDPETIVIDPDGENRLVTVSAGNYILHQDDRGFVDLWIYDTEDEARAEFNRADEAYVEWLSEDEDE